KIPRLRADTLAENAYVDHLTEQEVDFAEQVAEGKNMLHYVETHPLREARSWTQLHSTANAAGQPNGEVLLLRFEQGRPPRFVSVGRGGDPARKDLPSPNDIDTLLNIAKAHGHPPTHVV